MPRNPSGPMPGSPSRRYPSIVNVVDETVQNVGSCERMLGLKVGVSKRQMADRLPVGEPRFVHFGEPGTTLQPGAWAGPTHVMVVEHRSDDTSLITRPFLDTDEDDTVNEPGDRLEDMVKVPSQKITAGQNYDEKLVFDVCPTKSLPASREVREPPHAVTFDFAHRKGDSMSLSVLRSYCPQKWRPLFSEEVIIGSAAAIERDMVLARGAALAREINTLESQIREQSAERARVAAAPLGVDGAAPSAPAATAPTFGGAP